MSNGCLSETFRQKSERIDYLENGRNIERKEK